MKKPLTLPLPKCKKCKKTLEPEFTTEQEEGDKGRPKVLMMFGRCDDCNLITMCDIIDTSKINFVDAVDSVQEKENE